MGDIVPLFTSKTMGFLNKLVKGSSAASGIVGAVGGLGSLIFGNSRQKSVARYQQKLQMELNAQQQQYARENAQLDYDRQRALVRDNASLEKAGRQAAGLSTAGDFGSGSASVSPISAPSAGSAPTMPDPNASMLAGIQTVQASANSLLDATSVMAENRLKNSQSQLNETDAITRGVKNITEIRQMRANARNAEERAKYQMMENAIMEKFGMSNAQLENEIKASEALTSSADASVRSAWNAVQYDTAIANLDKLRVDKDVSKATKREIEERIKTLKAERLKIPSEIELNKSQTDLNREHATQVGLENVINGNPDIAVSRYNAMMSELRGKILYGSYPYDKSKMALRIIDEYFAVPTSMRKKWLSDNAAKFATYGVVCNLDKAGDVISFGIKSIVKK